MSRRVKLIALLSSGTLCAAGAGVLGAEAVTGSSAQAPVQTTTVTISNGTTGPAGPAGPPGADGVPGAESCPAGSTFQAVVFNHPGGHITLWVCVAG